MAKPGKENQGATPISLKSAKDTTRLRKHISSVIDRINKGGRISDSKNPIEGKMNTLLIHIALTSEIFLLTIKRYDKFHVITIRSNRALRVWRSN